MSTEVKVEYISKFKKWAFRQLDRMTCGFFTAVGVIAALVVL